ncbi:endoglucanase A-like [Ruditapes philippinarum]|uniref:endoglucanase A-like n=1 Tax=Ruditapes philippinarum TaxID=129788 RepID=UPI00295B2335|nr:endoglucanase A-like [Ruditapes philippinarum]
MMYIILCVVLFGGALADNRASVTQSWNGGFKGDITVHGELHDWRVHLKFDRPVNNVEVYKLSVEGRNSDGTEFTLRPLTDFSNLAAGSSLTFLFVVRQNGDQVPYVTYTVDGKKSDKTTTTTTTQKTTTTTRPPTSTTSTTSPVSKMKYDYKEALRLSILFYDAQRSGRLPPYNPIPWRGDSALSDGADGHDLSGGWYDGGDHVKFGLPMAWSTWVLLYGMLEFKDGYVSAGQKDMACDMIRIPLEYFLKCWIPDQQTLYVQVGDGHTDHGYWGRPEDMKMNRPVYKVTTSCPGSDVAGDTAAAMAAGYLVFKDMCADTRFSDKLLNASKSLYEFAKNNRGIYSDCVIQAKDFYESTSEVDDLAVAGAWLYIATNKQSYLDDAKGFYPADKAWTFSWNDANAGAALLLYNITKDVRYKTDIKSLVHSFQPGGDVPITPCGLAWRDQWSPNGHAGNVAFVATLAAKYGIQSETFKKWALSQINYFLGDNKLNISYEIGFGNNFPKRPHHRGSSCSINGACASGNDTNPNILKGGLIGGPGQWDNFDDRRDNYVQNEIACDNNAGFQSVLAGFLQFAQNGNLPPSPARKC